MKHTRTKIKLNMPTIYDCASYPAICKYDIIVSDFLRDSSQIIITIKNSIEII